MNSSIINFQIDSYDKELAEEILKDLDLDLNDYLIMAIKQLIYKSGLPFDLKQGSDLLIALKEADEIEKDIKNGINRGYNNADEMLKAILND